MAVPTQRFEQQRIELNAQPYEATSVAFRFAGENEASTILTLRNIAEEEELQELATHDALTGTFNTRFFTSMLPRQIELVRNGSGASMALLDLDHFKPINDELGHAAGDAALITFANVVRAELRTSDLLARLGGDEFAIVFPNLTAAEAGDVVRRIYDRMERTPHWPERMAPSKRRGVRSIVIDAAHDIAGGREIREDDGELVSAEARQEIGRAKLSADDVGECDQCTPAGASLPSSSLIGLK